MAKSFHLGFLLFEELQVHHLVPHGGRQLLPSAREHHQQRSAESSQLHRAHSDLESPFFLCKCQGQIAGCQRTVSKKASGLSEPPDCSREAYGASPLSESTLPWLCGKPSSCQNLAKGPPCSHCLVLLEKCREMNCGIQPLRCTCSLQTFCSSLFR